MSLKTLIAPLAASAALAFAAPASAQSTGWLLPSATIGYAPAADAPQSYQDFRRIAYDEGYREGLRRGEQDSRRGDRYDYQNDREFQRGDRGYNRGYGDRDRYRSIFRDGFAAGYRDGYGRYSSNNRGPYRDGPYRQGPYSQQGPYYGNGGRYPGGGYNSPAFDNGVQDGYEKGQEDARKNRSFDPLRHSWYRSGDRHYEGRYGSRDQYKDVYRRGFQQGYERGFREGRYRW